jgi:hypothetical protein
MYRRRHAADAEKRAIRAAQAGRDNTASQMDSFQISSEKSSDTSYCGSLEGHDLEGITKVGWDAQTGTPVDSIPTPVAGPGNKENLWVAVAWPAPSPQAQRYIGFAENSAAV